MDIDFTCTTTEGLWSYGDGRVVRMLRLSPDSMLCEGESIENEFGELRAYFDPSTWNVNDLGLIYTDYGWLDEFKTALEKLGFGDAAVNDIEFSEQGMQGDDYVSMDIGHAFLAAYRRLTGEALEPDIV